MLYVPILSSRDLKRNCPSPEEVIDTQQKEMFISNDQLYHRYNFIPFSSTIYLSIQLIFSYRKLHLSSSYITSIHLYTIVGAIPGDDETQYLGPSFTDEGVLSLSIQ
jgi:hypothetical protein